VRNCLHLNKDCAAPRSTREDLWNTEKLCLKGHTVRDLCSAAVENACIFVRQIKAGSPAKSQRAGRMSETYVLSGRAGLTQKQALKKLIFLSKNMRQAQINPALSAT
jgi:hypothetical protein